MKASIGFKEFKKLLILLGIVMMFAGGIILHLKDTLMELLLINLKLILHVMLLDAQPRYQFVLRLMNFMLTAPAAIKKHQVWTLKFLMYTIDVSRMFRK